MKTSDSVRGEGKKGGMRLVNKNVMTLVVLSRAVLVTVLMDPRSHVIWNHIFEA